MLLGGPISNACPWDDLSPLLGRDYVHYAISWESLFELQVQTISTAVRYYAAQKAYASYDSQ
jgi:hypothetical protein